MRSSFRKWFSKDKQEQAPAEGSETQTPADDEGMPGGLEARGAAVYLPGVSGALLSAGLPDKVLRALYRPSWDLENARVVRRVHDEYSYFVTQTCGCGGVYGINPLTRGQVAFRYESKTFDALVTQCLLCGEERSFLFDVTSCYGTPDRADDRLIQRVVGLWFTRLAHAFTEVVLDVSRDRDSKEHARVYFVVREVLTEELDRQPDLLHQPIDIQAVWSKVQARIG